jgi:glyoxylase-like metal-dependent hydrolase (beta-lactamase superfamily II)
MHMKKVGRNVSLIDLQTGGFKNLIASYVLEGTQVAVVETGPTSSVSNLFKGLEELNVEPEEVTYLAISHVHIDHGGGAGTALKRLSNARVIIHSKGAPHLKDPTRLWEASQETLGDVAAMFGKPEPVPEDRIIVAKDGETFNLGKGLRLTVIEAPGHASHNLAYYEHLNRGIFPGDAAGAYLEEFDAVFPTTPPPFRPDFALASLDRLVEFRPEVLHFSHFGKASEAVKRLRNYQGQIRTWLRIARDSVSRGESTESICERILREDLTIQKTIPAITADPVSRKTLIENSVEGFVEFVRNPRT